MGRAGRNPQGLAGGSERKLVRVPRNLQPVKTANPTVAGIPQLVQKFIPGTMHSPVEKLNPARRYRNCLNDPGVSANPFLAFRLGAEQSGTIQIIWIDDYNQPTYASAETTVIDRPDDDVSEAAPGDAKG